MAGRVMAVVKTKIVFDVTPEFRERWLRLCERERLTQAEMFRNLIEREDIGVMYTTWGPVRQGCDHAHKTIETALDCLHRDRSGAASQGGYSDRSIRIIEDRAEASAYDMQRGPGRSLTPEEWENVIRIDHERE